MGAIQRLGPGPVNSRVVKHGNVAYLSGIVAEDKSADIAGQTRQVLARIERLLADAGSSKAKLLWATVYMANLDQKDAMNEVWCAWIDPKNPPVRTCVGATLTPKTLIEIMVMAAVD
jgi:enamine deaminase RidA (YjgF/YER057c/UK114 family)